MFYFKYKVQCAYFEVTFIFNLLCFSLGQRMRPAVHYNEVRRETKVKIKGTKRRMKQNVVFVQKHD